MTTTSDPHPAPEEARSVPTGRGARWGLGVLAVVLVAGGYLFPLWQATLDAPQYPGGLTMSAYGHQVTGDIEEIDTLNHYVGMRAFDPATVPEMKLWPLAIGVALLAAAVAVLVRHRLAKGLAKLYLWGLPFGVLGMIQLRLHQYGQDLDPAAALRLDPFTPWVVGPTRVWNFTTWARPGLGLVCLLAAAALVSFGPRLVRRLRGMSSPAVATALLAMVVLPAWGAPALAAEGEGHDHGGHDHRVDDGGGGEVHDRGRTPDAEGPPALTRRGEGSTDGGGEGSAGGGIDPSRAPRIGPGSGPSAMPTIPEHETVGDLADILSRQEAGSRLALPAATYPGPIVIDEPVTIEGRDLPVLDGNGQGTVLTIRAPGTVIRDVVVRGSGAGPTDAPAAIRIEADDVTIERVVVLDSYLGISVEGAQRVRLLDNHVHGRAHAGLEDDAHAVAHEGGDGAEEPPAEPHAHEGGDGAEEPPPTEPHAHDDEGHGDRAEGHGDHAPAAAAGRTPGRGDGIHLHDAEQVLVRDNHIQGTRDGVYVSFGTDTLLDGNHVHDSRYAVHSMFTQQLTLAENHFSGNLSGAVVMYGADALVLRNQLEQHASASTGFGLLLKDVAGARVVENLLVDNRVGLHVDGPAGASEETRFTANTVARNVIGLQAYSSATARFQANSFADNQVQVASQGGELHRVSWSAEGWGNYWSSYQGFDAAGEGRGASPHAEGGTVDRLLVRNPELLAIADTPAMRLLRTVEERWGRQRPVLTDELPLTRPQSPALPTAPPEPTAGTAANVLGALLLAPAALLALRSTRRRSVPIRRSLRVAHS